jgi:hypothetical protein
MKKIFAGILVGLAVVILIVWSLVSWLAPKVVNNGVDFFSEQQRDAKSVGDLIGKQYSQLRKYSTALDAQSCKIQVNEAAAEDLKTLNKGKPESEWPELNQKESANLRLEHRTLLQVYADVASKYNNLATDIRTLVDDAGLKIKDIPQAEAVSPIPGMCNGFKDKLPETPSLP